MNQIDGQRPVNVLRPAGDEPMVCPHYQPRRCWSISARDQRENCLEKSNSKSLLGRGKLALIGDEVPHA